MKPLLPLLLLLVAAPSAAESALPAQPQLLLHWLHHPTCSASGNKQNFKSSRPVSIS
jgi:hypothetical protein